MTENTKPGKNFRLDLLKPEDLQFIQELFQKNGIDPTEGLSQLNKNGTLPPDLVKNLSQDDRNAAQAIVAKIPSANDAYNQYINSTKDEANLTDEELQNKYDAYKGLVDAKGQNRSVDYEAYANDIANTFFFNGRTNLYMIGGVPVGKEAALDGARYAAHAFFDGTPLKAQDFADIVHAKSEDNISPLEFEAIKNQINNQHDQIAQLPKQKYVGYQPYALYPNANSDASRLQQLITGRNVKNESEKNLNSFITSLPQELARGREDYLNVLQQDAEQNYQNSSQIAAGNLNARGLARGGDLQAELSRSAANSFQPVQDAAISLQQQDDDFFQNAAYQATLQKEIQSGNDIAGQIQSDRQLATQNQSNNFNALLAQNQATYNNQSYQRQLENQLQIQRVQLKRQQDLANQQTNNANISALAGGLSQIGTAYLSSGRNSTSGSTNSNNPNTGGVTNA